MGIETAAEYGGAESSFTAAIIVVEGASAWHRAPLPR
jgi:hypothetical protein